MKKDKHPVDTFFKEVMQEHQVSPSEESRQRFLIEVFSLRDNKERDRRRWMLTLILSGIFSVAILLVLFRITDQSGKDDVKMSEKIPSFPLAPTGESQRDRNSREIASREIKSARKEAVADVDSGYADGQQFPEPYSTKPDEVQATLVVTDSGTHGPPSETYSVMKSSDDSTMLYEKKRVEKIRRDPVWFVEASVYYSPEWMFNTLEGEKYVSNFGFEGTYRYGRYSVRTGIGLSVATGSNESLVEYNDYIGSYKQLDSITFAWDSRHYYLIPTYYLSNQSVWDSVKKTVYPTLIKRYTYLQIPLILGYDLLQQKWFRLGFRAGPVLSILLESNQLSDDYNPGMNRIIRINRITPDRIQTNWQVTGAVNLSILLSKGISLEFEPQIKYYFNSVYEKSGITKKPWSVDSRVAFTIRL